MLTPIGRHFGDSLDPEGSLLTKNAHMSDLWSLQRGKPSFPASKGIFVLRLCDRFFGLFLVVLGSFIVLR